MRGAAAEGEKLLRIFGEQVLPCGLAPVEAGACWAAVLMS